MLKRVLFLLHRDPATHRSERCYFYLVGECTLETVTVAEQIATSQVVWSILCILLAGYVLWHSNKRETRLLDNLSELTKAQQEQARAMQKISENLDTLEGRMDRMEKYTYKNKKECS